MPDWQPQWKSDPDPKPRDVVYEWNDDDTGETLFLVEVSAVGMINVLENDWLSKYTRAIHGSFDVHARFIRINPTERTFASIENVDLIYKDEIVLHMASFLAFQEWLARFTVEEGEIPEEITGELLEDIQSYVNWTSAAAAAEVVGWTAEFALVGAAGLTVGGIAAIAGLALGLWSALNDIIEVNNPEITAEQFYAIVYTTTAWVYGNTSETTTHPTTDEDLGEFNPYIPQLPFAVPVEVANPKSWFYIHDYHASFGLGTMSKDLIVSKLNLLKGAWEDTAADTIDTLGDLFEEATHVLSGGDPTLTLDEYRLRLRRVMLPNGQILELTKAKFFAIMKKQTYKTFRANWTGPSAPLNAIKGKESKYISIYPVPR